MTTFSRPAVVQEIKYGDGPPGKDGRHGKDGAQGNPGEKGARGERGERGVDGINGRDGIDGARGPEGRQGPQGIAGLPGDLGEKGETGDRGERGEIGPRGERGEKGDKGERGVQGERGERGERGEQGALGEQGAQGDQGAQGLQGERGDRGDRGRDGEDLTAPLPKPKGRTLFGSTTGEGPVRLTWDRKPPGPTNTGNIPENTVYFCRLTIIGVGYPGQCVVALKGFLTRKDGLETTEWSNIGPREMGGDDWPVTVSADKVNGGLAVTADGPKAAWTCRIDRLPE